MDFARLLQDGFDVGLAHSVLARSPPRATGFAAHTSVGRDDRLATMGAVELPSAYDPPPQIDY
jgi:hypothetical protein